MIFADPAAEAAAWRLFGAVAVFVAVFFVLAWWRATNRVRRNNRARARVARVGEIDAEALLAAHGFEVVGRQVTQRWSLWVDGEELEVHCRADLVVRPRRDRRARYVAEVKTGRAANVRVPATRRQLLEYAMVFDVDGVLLLDMVHREIRRIEFSWPDRQPDLLR
ncbi:MAG: hypothetical protein R3F59_09055 [Myxococcota bacterium]